MVNMNGRDNVIKIFENSKHSSPSIICLLQTGAIINAVLNNPATLISVLAQIPIISREDKIIYDLNESLHNRK